MKSKTISWRNNLKAQRTDTMEETRIVRMNSQVKGPGMLERVVAGDTRTIIELQELVQGNNLTRERLPLIFGLATKSALKRKKEVELAPRSKRASLESARIETHKLATLCAHKMCILYPEYLESLHKSFLFCMAHAEKVELKDIQDLSLAQMVLIGQDTIVRNGRLIEIAEAVADGIANAKDADKTDAILKLGNAMMKALPGGTSGDLAKIYLAVYTLALRPTTSETNEHVSLLRRRLELMERGDTNLRRIIGDLTKERMKKTIAPKEEPQVIFEQPPLPIPNIGKPTVLGKRLLQMAKRMLPFAGRKERKLAFAGRTN